MIYSSQQFPPMSRWRRFRQRLSAWWWRMFNQKIFCWNAEPPEEGGSPVLTIFGFIHLLKYKESTIVRWGRWHEYQQARKYVEAFDPKLYPDHEVTD